MIIVGVVILSIGILVGALIFARPSLAAFSASGRVQRRTRKRLEAAFALDRRQKRLLARLARGIDQEEYTSLMIGRGCFEHAVARDDLKHDELLGVERLRKQLFHRPLSGTST